MSFYSLSLNNSVDLAIYQQSLQTFYYEQHWFPCFSCIVAFFCSHCPLLDKIQLSIYSFGLFNSSTLTCFFEELPTVFDVKGLLANSPTTSYGSYRALHTLICSNEPLPLSEQVTIYLQSIWYTKEIFSFIDQSRPKLYRSWTDP